MATDRLQFSLRVGVIVDTIFQGQVVSQALVAAGYRIATLILSGHCRVGDLHHASQQVDVWLVDVDFEAQSELDFLLDWALDESDQPVMMGEGIEYESPEYRDWLRRTIGKLPQMSGQVRLSESHLTLGREVWVLGASTGGPEAVKNFLKQLPPGLGIAFVYVQHIDSGFEKNLVNMLKNTRYRPFIAASGDLLYANTVAILTQAETAEILENGTLLVRSTPWLAAYAPSVDQVLINVARRFAGRCGAIIFSGMGDDGASGARFIAQAGGQVWVQEPSTCTVAAMPEAVMAAVAVNQQGSVEYLAQQLANRFFPDDEHNAVGCE